MALDDTLLMELLEDAGPVLVKAFMTTLRWRLVDEDKYTRVHREHGPVIWAFWHAQLAFPAFMGRGRMVRILISAHRDGEFVARLVKGLGIEAVRGSSTRGGLEGFSELARTPPDRDIAITPDGPRGPRERVQPGVITLAQLTGRPIQPLGGAAHPCRRLKSWDRFVVPLPFAAATFCAGDPIFVPQDIDARGREEYRGRLETELKRISRIAQQTCVSSRRRQCQLRSALWQ